MAKKNKKTNWQREDKLLDYIVTHKTEITRYLVVVLVGELWRWTLDNIIYNLVPFMKTFSNGFTFFLWALPYFVVCKLWVWKQRDDGYTWGMQGLKFLMSIFVIMIANSLVGVLFNSILMLGTALSVSLSHLIEEILYFLAMFYFVLKPRDKF